MSALKSASVHFFQPDIGTSGLAVSLHLTTTQPKAVRHALYRQKKTANDE
jgi:hypothetical protein